MMRAGDHPRLSTAVIIAAFVFFFCALAIAENIDPAENNSQNAFSENSGWLNAEPTGEDGPGVTVYYDRLEGFFWAENIGWISLSCENTSSCATVMYGVVNDGDGKLSGYAWSENVGWINFAPADGGVTIDKITGKFSGYAWGENIGWINFSDTTDNSFSAITHWGHDHDSDGLTSPEEVHIYGTSYNVEDSDDDGVDDGAEAEYWVSYYGDWLRDFDQDGQSNNLLDPDADDDGHLDGFEMAKGSNPAMELSIPLEIAVDFNAGFNLVGFADPPAGYSAYLFLQALGSDAAISIQRFMPVSGTFETATFDLYGQVSGVDFEIVAGEGYIVYMNEPVWGFEPQ